MKLKIFGIGAAGNKAVINMLENQYVSPKDVVLINSTLKDIPEKWKEHVIRLSDDVQGCGQERQLAQAITCDAIESKRLNLEEIVTPDYDKAIIITSTNGGTGSGAATVIAGFLQDPGYIGIETEVIGLVGFEDESPRALRNLIEFLQDLSGDFAIQLIRNSAYLRQCRGNRSAAEQEANEEVARRIIVMSGAMLKASEQNIDDKDIAKLNNAHGYKTVEYMEIDEKIKNREMFNDYLIEMLDNSPSMDSESGKILRLGVMMNLNPGSQKFIDGSFNILRERYGEPYEKYTHIEWVPEYPQFIAIIASGMGMPSTKVQNIYNKYIEMSEKIVRDNDDFFKSVRELRGFDSDTAFDTFSFGSDGSPKKNNKDAAKNALLSKYRTNISPAALMNNKRNNNSNNDEEF